MNFTGNHIGDAIDDSFRFEGETEDEFTDCELCGDAFLVENIEKLYRLENNEWVEYIRVCPECVKLNSENK